MEQNYAPPNPRLPETTCSGLRTHPRWHVCWISTRGDERNSNGKVQLTAIRLNLLDGVSKILQGSLEGSIISLDINPGVADVTSEGE